MIQIPETQNPSSHTSRFPYLRVTFSDAIDRDDLPAVRGAIVRRVGRELDLFHNHGPEGDKLHRYPLIQYKFVAGCPGIVALGEGVEEVQAYLALRDRSLRIGERTLRMDVAQLQLRTQPLRRWENFFSYRVQDWIALHGPHLEAYKQEPRLAGRIAQLERKLNSNLRAFTRALGWSGDGQIDARIHHVGLAGHVTFKGIQFRAFDVGFSTNVLLPPMISIGKGSAFGYGTVTPNHRKA
jgi:hypothetical protein